MCTSCEQHSVPAPTPHIVVLKFKKPEYKNFALATHIERDSICVATRFNHCGSPTGQSGYSPFWELPDEWLMVDWKWYNFPYMPCIVLLPDITWKDYPFETFPLPKWNVSDQPYIPYPVEKILYINMQNLEKYSQTTFSSKMKAVISGNLTIKNDTTSNLYGLCEKPEVADSMWTILQKHLSVAIQNGDLEYINDEKYNSTK